MLRGLGTFEVPPPRADGEFEVVFKPGSGSGGEEVKTNHQQLLPQYGRLVFTEAVLGLVLYVGVC